MKTYVIGDVHGCYEQLEELLGVISPNLARERLVLLGDYIDRGPESYRTIQKLMKLQKTFGKKNVVLLRGNHEQMAIDFLENHDNNYLWNGGDQTISDFKQHGDSLTNYLRFFKELPAYFEDKYCIYVHAGIRHGINMSHQNESDLLWIRDDFYNYPVAEIKTVIFGHTPTQYINNTLQPYISKGRIGIDTGCIYGGHLSAIELQEGKLVAIYQTRKAAA